MKLQELFDKSVAHLRKQGVKSVNKSLADESGAFCSYVACSYRGDSGLMCAIGCVIPDEEYSKNFEGKSASYVAEKGVSTLQGQQAHDLDSLQVIHDNYPPNQWEACWEDFAIKRKLKFSPLGG
jgi:hypothetical protein